MPPLKIAAQIFGIGAMLSLFLIYQQKSRKKILFAKLSADVFWVVHYLCLGGYAGMIPNLVGIFRELVFIGRKKHKWASIVLWPILFILINWGLGFRTFHSAWNLLPIAASTFVTVSLWIDNPRLTKIISIPVSSAFLIYNIYLGSPIGVCNEALAIVSIIISFIKEHKKQEKKGSVISMSNKVFSPDYVTDKELIYSPGEPITDRAGIIYAEVSEAAIRKGNAFADEIEERFLGDFEKPGDRMAHVSTFIVMDDTVFVRYHKHFKGNLIAFVCSKLLNANNVALCNFVLLVSVIDDSVHKIFYLLFPVSKNIQGVSK